MSDTSEIFRFKEIDPEGFETLRVISDAHNFNRWTYESIKNYCSGNILEIGSGIGNISEMFIRSGNTITLSDIRENYLTFLRNKYPVLSATEKIRHIDLVHPEFPQIYKDLLGTFDTVFALNVVEHIEDDVQAVLNCYQLIKPGGQLVLLMPAFQWLYNNFDKELYHFRRYNSTAMNRLLINGGFNVRETKYFNAGGIPGWFVSGKLMNHKTIPQGQMKLFDTLVPAFRLLDTLLMKKIGLSVIGVGRKPF